MSTDALERRAAADAIAGAASPPSGSGMNERILQINDFCVDYGVDEGAVRAVDGVDLHLDRSKVLGVAGESGSGKSTLVYGFTRLLRAPALITGGTAFFNVGIAAAIPELAQELDQIQLVPLSDRRVLMVLVTSDHMVRNRVVMLDEPTAPEELTSICNYVNRNFSGWQLGQARRELLRRIETQLGAPSVTASPSRMGSKTSKPALDLIYVNAECANVLDRNPAFVQLFLDNVKMSPEDHAADVEAIARQREYGSTGDEECAIYRYTGRAKSPTFTPAA